MSCTCGCCEGLRALTPLPIENRPGLGAIRTRIGTHSSFLETMLARLSSADHPPLAALRTRDPADSAIALLDAWAIVADVLTFYQERIANEAYLRTATERRSLVELARLIGYAPRPGVAASVFLAFGLEKDTAPVVIPKGTKANSIPNPGETMQPFETSEDLPARFAWNAIRPRLVQPQTSQMIVDDRAIFLKGTATRLKPGDMLVLTLAGSAVQRPVRITAVDADEATKRTRIELALRKPKDEDDTEEAVAAVLDARSLAALLVPNARAPRSSAQLERSVRSTFAARADAVPKLLVDTKPALAKLLYSALRNAAPAVPQPLEVYAMRIEARPFGHNAPLKLTEVGSERVPPRFGEWVLFSDDNAVQKPNSLALDADYEVAADTRIVIEKAPSKQDEDKAEKAGRTPPEPTLISLVSAQSIRHRSLAAFGMSGKSLVLSWKDKAWLKQQDNDLDDFSVVRGSRIYLGSEKLELADAPMTEDIEGESIELNGLYDGLEPGRWLIVEGERTDIPDGTGNPIPGIRATELVMLSGVEQVVRGAGNGADGGGSGDVGAPKLFGRRIVRGGRAATSQAGPEPGDTYHSVLAIAASTAAGVPGLAYRYKRETVTIYANVAPATHGETRGETLGSGNAAQALQSFLLRQPPLTYVPARTPSGIASTLEVRVNDVLWHEASTLAGLAPADRKYVTVTGDGERTAVIFGNGRQGARLPTGRENVTARYRNGIGAPGNVAARQISLLATRPLGVKDVVNPIRASGGADREGPEAIRRNAPIAIMALDRLLSTVDYADFARSFAGIGKASAWRDRSSVHVIIAGVEDAPIDASSALFINLKDALHRFGDPQVRLVLTVSKRLSMVVQAGVRIDPDYLWEVVEPKIRAAMLAAFAFETQGLGAPAFLSHAFRAIQSVRGVASVDIEVFDAIPAESLTGEASARLADRLSEAKQRISPDPDQIAYLAPTVPDTLILQEVPS